MLAAKPQSFLSSSVFLVHTLFSFAFAYWSSRFISSRISMFDESLLRDRQGWRCAPRQVSSSVWQLDSSLDVSLQPGSAACRDKIRTQHPSTLFSSLLKQPRDPHQVLESVFSMVRTCGLDQIASKGVGTEVEETNMWKIEWWWYFQIEEG